MSQFEEEDDICDLTRPKKQNDQEDQPISEVPSEGQEDQPVSEVLSEGQEDQLVSEVLSEGQEDQLVSEVLSEGQENQPISEVPSEGQEDPEQEPEPKVTSLVELIQADIERNYEAFNNYRPPKQITFEPISKRRLLIDAAGVSRRVTGHYLKQILKVVPYVVTVPLVNFILRTPQTPEYADYLARSVKECSGLSRFEQGPAQIDLGTLDYSDYFKKIDWKHVKALRFFKGSLFCSFPPDMVLKNTHTFVAQIESKTDSRRYFISGDNYHSLVAPETIKKHQILLLQQAKKLNLTQQVRWHQPYMHGYYQRHDLLPLKMNDLFHTRCYIKHEPRTKKYFLRGAFFVRPSLMPAAEYRPYHKQTKKQTMANATKCLKLKKRKIRFSLPSQYVLEPQRVKSLEHPTYQERLRLFIKKRCLTHNYVLFQHRLIHYTTQDTLHNFKTLLKSQYNQNKNIRQFNVNNFFIDPKYGFCKKVLPLGKPGKAFKKYGPHTHKLLPNMDTSKRTFTTDPDLEYDDSIFSPKRIYTIEQLLQHSLAVDALLSRKDSYIPTKEPFHYQRSTPFGPKYTAPDYIRQPKNPKHYYFTRKSYLHEFRILSNYQEAIFDYIDDRLSPLDPASPSSFFIFHQTSPKTKALHANIFNKVSLGFKKAKIKSYLRSRANILKHKIYHVKSPELKRQMSGYLFPDMPVERCRQLANRLIDPFNFAAKLNEPKENSTPTKPDCPIEYQIYGPADLMGRYYPLFCHSQNLFLAFDTLSRSKNVYASKDSSLWFGQKVDDMGFLMRWKQGSDFDLKGYLFEDEEDWFDATYDWQDNSYVDRGDEFDVKLPFGGLEEKYDTWYQDNYPRVNKKIRKSRGIRKFRFVKKRGHLLRSKLPVPNYVPKKDLISVTKADAKGMILKPVDDQSLNYTQVTQYKMFTNKDYNRENFFTRFNYHRRISLTVQNQIIENPIIATFQISAGCIILSKVNKIIAFYTIPVFLTVQEFLFSFDLQALKHLFSKHTMKFSNTGISFRNVVDGQDLMGIFSDLILSLRRTKHGHIHIEFEGPSRYEPKNKPMYVNQRYMPKGFLLVGPPGTGKTFLAKALGTESKVPVMVFGQEELPPERSPDSMSRAGEIEKRVEVEHIFEAAKFFSPSIVFIDEVDGIGPKRLDVSQTVKRQKEGPDLIYGQNEYRYNTAFYFWARRLQHNSPGFNFFRNDIGHWKFTNTVLANNHHVARLKNFFSNGSDIMPHLDMEDLASTDLARDPSNDALQVLTRLLIELDGMVQRDVIVFAATNRPNALDPALTRPGRLNKVIYLDLPNEKKRFDLLSFYSGNALMEVIDWKYFAKQTSGLSPAHLKAAMNISSLRNGFNVLNKIPIKMSSGSLVVQGIIDQKKPKGFQKWLKSLNRESKETTPTKVYKAPKVPDDVQPLHTMGSIHYAIQNVRHESTSTLEQHYLHIFQRLHQLAFPPFVYDGFNQFQNVSYQSLELMLPKDFQEALRSNFTIIFDKKPDNINIQYVKLQKQISKMLNRYEDNVQKRPKPLLGKAKVVSPLQQNRKEMRKKFFKKIKPALQKAYLCDVIDKSVHGESVLTPTEEKFFNAIEPKVRDDLRDAARLSHRMFKYNMFGTRLLLNSPCSQHEIACLKPEPLYQDIDGQYIQSNIQFASWPSNSVVLNALLTQTKEKKSLFETNYIRQAQKSVLDDAIMINRAAYYNSCRAIAQYFVKYPFENPNDYRLMSLLKKPQALGSREHKLVRELLSQCHTRTQFECFLVTQLAGKAGELFMRWHQKENYVPSSIGQHDLDRAIWVARTMVENNLFYHQNVTPQSGIKPLSSSAMAPISLLDARSQAGPDVNKFSRRSPETWWMEQVRHPSCQPEWSEFIIKPKTPKQRIEITKREPQQYNENYLKQSQYTHTDNMLSEDTNPFNLDLLTTSFTLTENQYNQLPFVEGCQLETELIHNAYEQLFKLFDVNRELIDFLAYKITVHETITDDAMTAYIEQFLEDRIAVGLGAFMDKNRRFEPAYKEMIKETEMAYEFYDGTGISGYSVKDSGCTERVDEPEFDPKPLRPVSMLEEFQGEDPFYDGTNVSESIVHDPGFIELEPEPEIEVDFPPFTEINYSYDSGDWTEIESDCDSEEDGTETDHDLFYDAGTISERLDFDSGY